MKFIEPNRDYWIGLAVETTKGISEINRNDEKLKTSKYIVTIVMILLLLNCTPLFVNLYLTS